MILIYRGKKEADNGMGRITHKEPPVFATNVNLFR
jgi:hypothetical protein